MLLIIIIIISVTLLTLLVGILDIPLTFKKLKKVIKKQANHELPNKPIPKIQTGTPPIPKLIG